MFRADAAREARLAAIQSLNPIALQAGAMEIQDIVRTLVGLWYHQDGSYG